MKSSKNVMIGLMVVIVVVLMVSLMFSPFMSGLEGFQEGNKPAPAAPATSANTCPQFNTNCPAVDKETVKEMIKNRDKWVNGNRLRNDVMKTAEQKYKDAMANSSCKSLLVNNCDINQ